MVSCLYKNEELKITSCFIQDLGTSTFCILSPALLKIGEIFTIKDKNEISFDFKVSFLNKNKVIGKLAIFDKLDKFKITKSFKKNIMLKDVLKGMQIPISTKTNFNITNFGYSGTGLSFLTFCIVQYKLKFFAKTNELILYQNSDELEVKKHKLELVDQNKVKFDFNIRVLDFVNDKRIICISHLPNKNFSILRTI